MKLICPNCQKELASTHVNVEPGFATCPSCHEYFKVADYLRDDEEIRRIKKPHYSKVLLSESDDELVITIPAEGWSSGYTSIIFSIALACNVLSLGFFLSGNDAWLSLFFFLALPITAHLLYTAYSSTKISFNSSFVKLDRLWFGLNLSKTRITESLGKITEHLILQTDDEPVYGIGFFFMKNETQLVFGSKLKEEERKWLIGELYEMKNKLEAQRKSNAISEDQTETLDIN